MPAWFKREKIPKFNRHYSHRLGLEAIKIRQSMRFGNYPTEMQKKAINAEINDYINSCYKFEDDL